MKHGNKILKLLGLFFVLFSADVFGQNVMMGPTVGLNVSTITLQGNIYDASNPYLENIVGLRAGLQLELNADKLFSILTETTYSQQGLTIVVENDVYKSTASIYTPYITAAVIPKISFGNAPLKAFLAGGLYTGVLLNIRQRFENYNKKTHVKEVTQDDYSYKELKNVGLNRFDFGLKAAFGAEKSFQLGKLTLMIGYRVGLTNFFNKKYREEAAEEGEFIGLVKNKVFSVQAGYLFPLYRPKH